MSEQPTLLGFEVVIDESVPPGVVKVVEKTFALPEFREGFMIRFLTGILTTWLTEHGQKPTVEIRARAERAARAAVEALKE